MRIGGFHLRRAVSKIAQGGRYYKALRRDYSPIGAQTFFT